MFRAHEFLWARADFPRAPSTTSRTAYRVRRRLQDSASIEETPYAIPVARQMPKQLIPPGSELGPATWSLWVHARGSLSRAVSSLDIS